MSKWLLLGLATLLLMSGVASASTPMTACGYVGANTTGTTFTLMNNVSGGGIGGVACVVLQGTDNTLDCQGKSMSGGNIYQVFPPYYAGVRLAGTRNTVKNCIINGYTFGVAVTMGLGGIDTGMPGTDWTIDNVYSNNSQLAPFFVDGEPYIGSPRSDRGTIKNSIGTVNGFYGIYLYHVDDVLIENVTISQSYPYGLYFQYCDNITVRGSRFLNDLYREQWGYSNVTFENNLVQGNHGGNINTGSWGPSPQISTLIIRGNTFINNTGAYGSGVIGTDNFTISQVYNNKFVENTTYLTSRWDYIELQGAGPPANLPFNLTVFFPQTTGPNVIGGPFIGGNYYGQPDGQGYSDLCADSNHDGFCDVPYTIYLVGKNYNTTIWPNRTDMLTLARAPTPDTSCLVCPTSNVLMLGLGAIPGMLMCGMLNMMFCVPYVFIFLVVAATAVGAYLIRVRGR